MVTDMNENERFLLALKGNIQSQNYFFDKYKNEIIKRITFYFGLEWREEIEELFNDIFMKLFPTDKDSPFDYSKGGNLKGYLYVSMLNAMRNRLKSRNKLNEDFGEHIELGELDLDIEDKIIGGEVGYSILRASHLGTLKNEKEKIDEAFLRTYFIEEGLKFVSKGNYKNEFFTSDRQEFIEDKMKLTLINEKISPMPIGGYDYGYTHDLDKICIRHELWKKYSTIDERIFMESAIDEMLKSESEHTDKIDPKVGAVLVYNNEVTAKSYRKKDGHCEFNLLTALEEDGQELNLEGYTLYVTLEPCTKRKSPKIPCAERVIISKISKVVIGMMDPDPVIEGVGVKLLRNAGIEVNFFHYDLTKKVMDINMDFIKSKNVDFVHYLEREAIDY